MLARPAWYTTLKQQNFENNSDRLRTNLDPFKGVFRLPSGNNKKADPKLTVVMCCQIFYERYTTQSSGNIRRPPRLWTEHQPAGELLSKKSYLNFFVIMNSIYLKEIQTTVFYQKKKVENV